MSRAVVGSRIPGTWLPGQPVVVRVPSPPSGMGETARHHRASPQVAELTRDGITPPRPGPLFCLHFANKHRKTATCFQRSTDSLGGQSTWLLGALSGR
jgi:hypothetical protein